MNQPFMYDVVDYPSYLHVQMHPARLCAIARLHGVGAASPAQCRLLEVGCGDALQLLTLAQAYPDSQFVGVDLSTKAIARGEALRRAAGLDNLQLIATDLLEWDAGPEPFDYITAHGFFSWVPEVVRERLLAVCAASLSADGVAYVSYNAQPGGHLRQMVWQMLHYHVERDAPPERRIAQAAHLLSWIDHHLLDPKASRGYYAAMRNELDAHLKKVPPALLLHDDLSPVNTPLLFSEFMAQARAHDLDYLAEADYFETSELFIPTEARAAMDDFGADDRVARSQYLDFLKGCRFRQTLLARTGKVREADPAATLGMEVIANLRAQPDDEEGVAFSNQDGARLVASHPLVIEVFSALVNADRPRPAMALREQALAALGRPATADDDEALADALLFALRIGLLNLACDPPAWAAEAGEAPRIPPLLRAQLATGNDMLASLRPAIVRVDDAMGRELLRLLDGRHDRDALVHELCAWREANPGLADDRELSPRALDASLRGLAAMALFEA